MKKFRYGYFVGRIREEARKRNGLVRASDVEHITTWTKAKHLLLKMAKDGSMTKLPCGTLPGKWEPVFRVEKL